MRRILLLALLLLPFLCSSQLRIFRKKSKISKKDSIPNASNQLLDKPFTFSKKQHLNTAVLFPKPPKITHFEVDSSSTTGFTINACIVNLKSAEGLRLTQNGEEQPIRQQTSSDGSKKNCQNGYVFRYTLTPSAARNTISLEARNEGGATIHYLEVPAINPTR